MPSEYERKLIEMQSHIRENNAYLDDYMKDLNSWTDEIKKKEENLKTKTTNSSISTAKDLPPVRNFIEPAKPKKKSKKKSDSKQVQNTTSSSIHAYDYRAWDKYDVDAECERIDKKDEDENEDENGGDDDDDEANDEDEEWQEEVLKKKAEYYKECGNYQFKQKSYAEAIEFYTKAIECNPISPVYFANRAQCQLFEQRYGACEADCTLAIQNDKNYLKAYYRRSLARIELGKIDQAKEDLEYVLSREPANVDAKTKLNEIIKNDEIKRLGRVYPLHNKPLDQRSTKPLKRIEIQEIDTSIITPSETTKKKNIVIEEIETTEMPTFSEPVPILPVPTPAPPSHPSSTSQSEKLPPKLIIIPTSIPTTGYQFKRDWSNLNNQLEQQSIYFNNIPPTSYKTIFSTGIDSSVFSRILLFWSNKTDIDEYLINSMYELRQTPRFNTQLSFLGSEDKQLLQTTLDRLQTNSLFSMEKIQKILHDYKTD
ncbi:hypothetical protein I4U23_009676 [Adineta vaga]|nr:hypothetical protein I4U23_009676 [Adineta vaga]